MIAFELARLGLSDADVHQFIFNLRARIKRTNNTLLQRFR